MLLEQISRARRQIEAGEDRDRTVHEARKCFKRARALVRLVKFGLVKTDAKRLNAGLRDLGRLLAAERDRAVMIETLAFLEGLAGTANTQDFQKIRASLTKSQADVSTSHDDTPPADPGSEVDDMLGWVDEVEFDLVDCDAVVKGFERTYAKGRAQYQHVFEDDDDEEFHEWRKSVQSHWRQCAILRAAWPDEMAVRIGTARRISQGIGRDHDITVLLRHVEAVQCGTKRGRRKLTVLGQNTQTQIRAAVGPLGGRLYAFRREALAGALRQWWQAARRGDLAPAGVLLDE